MIATDTRRLAKAMTARRQELRLSARTAAQLAGINRATWSALEDGNRLPRQHVRAGIEQALGWEPGSVDSLLAGGPARVIRRAESAPADGPGVALVGEWVLEMLGLIKRLPADVKTKRRLVSTIIDLAEEALVESAQAPPGAAPGLELAVRGPEC